MLSIEMLIIEETRIIYEFIAEWAMTSRTTVYQPCLAILGFIPKFYSI